MLAYPPSSFYPQGQLYLPQMQYGIMAAPQAKDQPMFVSARDQNFNAKLCVYYSRNGSSTVSFKALPANHDSMSSSPDSTYEQSSSDNGAPKNAKTRLCRHYACNGRCPMSDNCGFAHGPEELQASSHTLAKRASNEKHKTELCKNYAKGGCRDCPYGWKCKFVHPEDKEYHLEFYADTEQFHIEQQSFKDRVQEKHQLKTPYTTDEEVARIDKEIMQMVKSWNKDHPRGPSYFDFHGLTVAMAEEYIKEIIDDLLAGDFKLAKIETGRGKHSVHGFAAIRATILANYEGYKGASFVSEKGNDGVLILYFP